MRVGDIFPWSKSFETGVPLIDEQHQQLVHLINQLASHLANGSDVPTLDGIFGELADYAQFHFQSEEAIWHQYLTDDDWELEHKEMHTSFIKEVLSLRSAENERSLEEVVESILKFLTHWLVFHILESDMRLAKAVLTVQSGVPIQQAKNQAQEEFNGAMRSLIESILSMYDGITTQTLALMKEVIARQQAEAKLRLSSIAIESTLDAVCITDAEFSIIEVNPSFCAKTQLSSEELLGRSLKELKSGLVSDDSKIIWSALLEKGHWTGELTSSTVNSASITELLTLSAVKNEDGVISNYVAIFSNINQLLMKQRKLEKLANHDKLTGLPNRILLSDRLKLAIARADRSKDHLGVCFLDLDGFKQVNDHYGHQAGDIVLQEVAKRLLKSVRSEDTVARLGGDEFVLLLGNLKQYDDYQVVIDRVLKAVALPIDIGDAVAKVGASVGVTVYPKDNCDADTLMLHADKAMYDAKQAGKFTYRLFDPEM